MAPQSVSEERGGGEEEGGKEEKERRRILPIRNKRKWKNRGFMVVKRRVLGRPGCGEEVMLMWQDLTCRPGGLIFFHAARRNQFCS
jgi:hypothetical protein